MTDAHHFGIDWGSVLLHQPPLTKNAQTMTSFDKHRKLLAPLKILYEDEGHELRFVGGCVRDWQLGLVSKDVDLATTLSAQSGMALLRKAGFNCIPTGIDHGTITVIINHAPYEITTLRKDVSTDGRRATICYTDDWREDAARRDFTINALYLSFDNILYDYFDGRRDLEEGSVRFIGEAEDRILEDYLRILRFFRFYARYGKQDVDLHTLKLCRKYASKLTELSTERITQEILRLLESPDCLKSLRLMDEYDILGVIFTTYDVDQLACVLMLEQKINFHLPHDHRDASTMRRLAALSDDHHALRLSKNQQRYLTRVDDLKKKDMTREDLNIWCYRVGIREVVDHLAIHTLVPDIALMQELLHLTIPVFPIKGKDIIHLGIPPGPKVKKLLDESLDWWCRGGYVSDRDACLAYVRERL